MSAPLNVTKKAVRLAALAIAVQFTCPAQNWWDSVLVAARCMQGDEAATLRIAPDVCSQTSNPDFPSGVHRTWWGPTYQSSWYQDVSSMPECLARDINGRSFAQSWQTVSSFVMDLHCPAWLNTVKQYIGAQVYREGLMVDELSTPGFAVGAGFGEWDKKAFMEYLKGRSARGQIPWLTTAPEKIDIAQYILAKGFVGGNPAALEDALFREFVRYQYRSNLDIWSGMVRLASDGATALNKSFLLYGNQYGPWMPHATRVNSILLSQYNKLIGIEISQDSSSALPHALPQYHYSLLYKLGLASGHYEKPVWVFNGFSTDVLGAGTPHRTNYWRLSIAETYANGAIREVAGKVPAQAGNLAVPEETLASVVEYTSWLRRNRSWLSGKRPRAAVALAYSIPTLLWRDFPATGHLNGEQNSRLSGFARALDDSHIPFDAVVFGHPDFWDDDRLLATLKRYAVVVLPGVDCVSDRQFKVLTDYLAAGGSIVATGSLGARDENFVARSSPLSNLFAGNSRVLVLGASPDSDYYNSIRAKTPDSKNLNALSTAVLKMLGSAVQVTTNAPATLAFNLFSSAGGADLFIHVLNYDLDFKTDILRPAGPVQVSLKLPAGVDPRDKTLWLTSPEFPEAVETPYEVSGGTVKFGVAKVASHSVLAFVDRKNELANLLVQARANPVLLYDRAESLVSALDSATADLAAGHLAAASQTLESFQTSAKQAEALRIYVDEHHDEALTVSDARAKQLQPENPQYALLSVLTSLGATVDRKPDKPIEFDELCKYDVLVVAAPRAVFAEGEKAAVRRFVRAGGGLVLIGDAGINVASMNSIAGEFGLAYLGPPVLAIPNISDLGSFDAGYIDQDHEVTKGLARIYYNWGTGLLANSSWVSLVRTNAAVWLDENGSLRDEATKRHGPFTNTAVRQYGKGRIASMGDNATFWAWGAWDNPALGKNAVSWSGGSTGPRRSVIEGAAAKIEAAAEDGRSVGLSNARSSLAAAESAASRGDYTAARALASTARDQAVNATSAYGADRSVLSKMVNAGDFGPDGGGNAFMSLFGRGLAITARPWNSSDFIDSRLPTELDGVSVAVNGNAAPVCYVSPTQVNFLLPAGVSGPAVIRLSSPSGSAEVSADLVPTPAALFCYSAANRRWAAAIHPDGVIVSREGLLSGSTVRPAAPGGFVSLYGTGFGPIEAGGSTGPIIQPVLVRIGGAVANVTYAGLISPGLYQINVIVPDVPDADHAVEVEVAGRGILSDSLIPVRR